MRTRPFRAPHQGCLCRCADRRRGQCAPGEISLAHNRGPVLDELPEFRRDALEALRPAAGGRRDHGQPRAAALTLPAQFMLVASMNPCPCGQFGTDACRCTPVQIKRYPTDQRP